MKPALKEPVGIVFYPESAGLPAPIAEWRERNPDWRKPVETVIVCPVCGITVLAMADTALLDVAAVQREIARYRDEHLRSACSDHWLPTQEYWAVVESRTR